MCCDVLVKRYLQWNQFWGYYFVLLIYLIRDFLSCSISAKKHFRIRRVCLFFFSRLSFLWGEWVGWEAENVIPSP
jgi:hypothetical protein